MRYIPTGEWMQMADATTISQYKMPSLVLMERAALSFVCRLEKEKFDLSKVLVVCGAGNNGGDGFAVARLLHLKGVQVHLFFVGAEEKMTKETKLQKEIANAYGLKERIALPQEEYSLVIDAIFGVGLSRPIQGRYRDIIVGLNKMSGEKVALDIPSGICSRTGQVLGTAFEANCTITFAFEKMGTFLYPGRNYAGKIYVEDIGIPSFLFDETREVAYTYERIDASRLLPKRISEGHKGSFGRVLVVGGSPGMAGAVCFNAEGAYRAGAGLVKVYTHRENLMVIQSRLPEALVTVYDQFDKEQLQCELDWADVVIIGSGLGTSLASREQLEVVCQTFDGPLLIDADGITILSQYPALLDYLSKKEQTVVLTPHLKELSRLLGKGLTDLQDAQKKKEYLEAFFENRPTMICVAKDARTWVYQKNQRLYVNDSGTSALSKGGAGDVLAGIIGGFMAGKMETFKAASLGVYLHGLAGEEGQKKVSEFSVLASDLLKSFSHVLANKGIHNNERVFKSSCED